VFITITPYVPASWEIESPFGLVYPCTTREKSDACPATGGGHEPVAAAVVAMADLFPASSSATTPSVYDLPHESDATVSAVDAVDELLTPSTNTS
jgi:hypothetical protein